MSFGVEIYVGIKLKNFFKNKGTLLILLYKGGSCLAVGVVLRSKQQLHQLYPLPSWLECRCVELEHLLRDKQTTKK